MPNSPFAPLAGALRPLRAAPLAISVPSSPSTLRSETPLAGAWRYRPDPSGEGTPAWSSPAYDDAAWATMPVPSNYSRLDPTLARFYGPVWFRTRFTPPAIPAGGSTQLLFEGIDYFAKVWLDGRLLAHAGEHEGGFTPVAYDVTGLVDPSRPHLLAVRVTNPYDAGLADRDALRLTAIAVEKIWPKGIFDFHDLRPGGVVDPDDAQSIGTGGIDRPVRIVTRGALSIDGVWVTPWAGPPAHATVDLLLTNHAPGEREADLSLWADPPTGGIAPPAVGERLLLAPGATLARVELPFGSVPPVLWWTWDHPELGGPALYRLHALLGSPGSPTSSDRWEGRFGFREVRTLAPEPGFDGYLLNGARLYLRGANYISTEWPYDWDLDRYRSEAALLRAAGVNFLRVHAHIEPPPFYDAMDEAGIGITQDLPLQWDYSVCDFERPDGDPTLTSNPEVIRRLAAETVLGHYNHPSLWVWTAHNEPGHAFNAPNLGGGVCPAAPVPMGERPSVKDKTLNRGLDDSLVGVMSRIDPFRPVHRASGEGDEHSYKGWYVGKYTDLFPLRFHFPTEFGAEGIPWSAASWMRAELGDAFWPIATAEAAARWYYHDFQIGVSSVHVGGALAPPDGCYDAFADWAFASQLYQAALLKAHVEQFRRERFDPTGGFTLFTFQSWWDSVTWGIVDAAREPLLAYDWVSQVNQPLLVAADDPAPLLPPGGTVHFPVRVVNDLFEAIHGARLTARLEEEDGFFLKGALSSQSSPEPPLQASVAAPPHAVYPLKGPDRPLRDVASAAQSIDLDGDSARTVDAGIAWNPPASVTSPKGYTVYYDLRDGSGNLLTSNWHHFAIATDPDAIYDDPTVGGCLTPRPRFNLTVRVLDTTGGIRSDLPPAVTEKYAGTPLPLVPSGSDWSAPSTPPGVYRVAVAKGRASCVEEVRLVGDRLVLLDLARCP